VREGGAQGCGPIKGGPAGILGMRTVEGAARSPARRAGFVGAVERGGDEAARWGRRASERRGDAAVGDRCRRVGPGGSAGRRARGRASCCASGGCWAG